MSEQENSILILTDLLIRLLAQVTCKYKVTIVIYFPIKYIKLLTLSARLRGKYNLYHLI